MVLCDQIPIIQRGFTLYEKLSLFEKFRLAGYGLAIFLLGVGQGMKLQEWKDNLVDTTKQTKILPPDSLKADTSKSIKFNK
jgi:hypothetical protein